MDWLDEAFFEEPERDSVDGGTTNLGPLWHGVSPRWGHSMHAMCSYHGMFPAKLVHYFIQRFSEPGDLVLDPFSGRGTVPLAGAGRGSTNPQQRPESVGLRADSGQGGSAELDRHERLCVTSSSVSTEATPSRIPTCRPTSECCFTPTPCSRLSFSAMVCFGGRWSTGRRRS